MADVDPLSKDQLPEDQSVYAGDWIKDRIFLNGVNFPEADPSTSSG
jgi:hypothetical protein